MSIVDEPRVLHRACASPVRAGAPRRTSDPEARIRRRSTKTGRFSGATVAGGAGERTLKPGGRGTRPAAVSTIRDTRSNTARLIPSAADPVDTALRIVARANLSVEQKAKFRQVLDGEERP